MQVSEVQSAVSQLLGLTIENVKPKRKPKWDRHTDLGGAANAEGSLAMVAAEQQSVDPNLQRALSRYGLDVARRGPQGPYGR